MFSKKFTFIILMMTVAGLTFIPGVAAELSINIVAVNGQDESKSMDIVYPLPIELEPDDIVDTGPLKLDYDVDKHYYYVYKEVEFNPKESKTFKVKVNDVWQSKEEDIDIIRQQMEGNLALLEGTEFFNEAKSVRDKLAAQMDYILQQQAFYSENIERRIEQFRAYKAQLDYIKKNIYKQEFLENEAKALRNLDEEQTVKFFIEVKNPSQEDERTIKQQHYLPQEVRAEHVLEKRGFDVRFEEEKGRCFLSKEELFYPDESKKYEIVIKDIWQFPFEKLDSLEENAQVAMDELEESMYYDSGVFLFAAIKATLEKIRSTQDLQVQVKEHIGLYRLNMKRYEELEDDLTRLEQLLALARAKRLQSLEEGRVKNVLSRLKALRGIAALSEALFKKGISVNMTWKIIFGTIIFVGLFTTIHFMIWAKRSKRQGEEQGLPEGEEIKDVPKPGEEAAKDKEE